MKNKKILRLILLLTLTLAAGAVWAGVSARRCSREVTVVRYEVETELEEAVRIVQLTDLHSKVFGEQNDLLVGLVAEAEPDLILMTGDMVDWDAENADAACALVRALARIAPVYYGYGNHEYAWMEANGESLTPVLEEAGAIVLDVAYDDIEVNGQPLRIGGYHGYYRQPGMYVMMAEEQQRQLDFCNDFENTQRYKLLLCHIPTAWLDWGYMNDCPVDLVLSGHYHGGQVRLPLIGGLYAPYVGLLPEFTEGMFEGEQATCILSTGLGSSLGLPRINNLPQIVVVELAAECEGESSCF